MKTFYKILVLFTLLAFNASNAFSQWGENSSFTKAQTASYVVNTENSYGSVFAPSININTMPSEAIEANLLDEMNVEAVADMQSQSDAPGDYNLKQNYPNPFNPSTVIKYSLPFESSVKLTIYNLIGEQVRQLVNKVEKKGVHEVNFNASTLSSGVYFYSIEASSIDGRQNYRCTKKLILQK
jgi:hypothetical protein